MLPAVLPPPGTGAARRAGSAFQTLHGAILVNAKTGLNITVPVGSSNVTAPGLWHGDVRRGGSSRRA